MRRSDEGGRSRGEGLTKVVVVEEKEEDNLPQIVEE